MATASVKVRTKKRLGQHFLVDRRALRRIVQAAELGPEDLVVEIGPGTGNLTRELASVAGEVLAIERDEALVHLLQTRWATDPKLKILQGDARTMDLWPHLPPGRPYKVVANLPYYAAIPIVRRFLEAPHKPVRMVLTVQREVVQAMAASAGRMRLLSVMVQLYSTPRLIAFLPPRAFRPPPKVTSAVVVLDFLPSLRLPLPPDEVEPFLQLVKAGFRAPRKQLRNALAHGLGLLPLEGEALLRAAGVDPKRRAETLSLEEWHRLYQLYRSPALSSSSSPALIAP